MPTFNIIAANFNSVDIPNNGRFWFSYNTCIAFMPFKGENAYTLFVHENTWSQTTGKHLNQIDGGDKKSRLSHTEFTTTYNACFPEL